MNIIIYDEGMEWEEHARWRAESQERLGQQLAVILYRIREQHMPGAGTWLKNKR